MMKENKGEEKSNVGESMKSCKNKDSSSRSLRMIIAILLSASKYIQSSACLCKKKLLSFKKGEKRQKRGRGKKYNDKISVQINADVANSEEQQGVWIDHCRIIHK